MPSKETSICQRAALYLLLVFLGMSCSGFLPFPFSSLLLPLLMLLPLLFAPKDGAPLFALPKSILLFLPLFFLLPFLNLSLAGLFGLFIPMSPAPSLPLWQALLFSALLPAIAEEILFRHVLLRSFCRNGQSGGALLLSALLFSLVHADFYQMPYAFAAGLLLGALALLSGSVLLPVLLHLWNNLLSLLLVPLFDFWVLFAFFGGLSFLSLLLLVPLWRKKEGSLFPALSEAKKDSVGRRALLLAALRSPLWLCVAVSLLFAVLRLM